MIMLIRQMVQHLILIFINDLTNQYSQTIESYVQQPYLGFETTDYSKNDNINILPTITITDDCDIIYPILSNT